MIKIIYYSHTIDYAGTWRGHEEIIPHLDRSKFEPYIVYWKDSPHNNRLEICKEKLGAEIFVSFDRSEKKGSPESGYSPQWTNFSEVVKSISPDIIHFVRGGYFEWPFTERLAPLQIETNIFAYNDPSPFLDKSIVVCNEIGRVKGNYDAVVYPPIPRANFYTSDLRGELGIPDNSIVFGRIGRPGNFASHAISAFNRLCTEFRNLKYVVIGPCDYLKLYASGNPNVIQLPVTNDDQYIERFFNTLDIFMHYRMEGECQSIALSQAMMYGLPCISHKTMNYNGQIETVADGGYVAANEEDYYQYARSLVLSARSRIEVGKRALAHAMYNYEASRSVSKLEELYIKWLGEA